MALADSNFVVLGPVNTGDTPNAQQLAVGTGLSLTPLGAGSTVTVGITGALSDLQGSLSTPGFPSFNISTGDYTRRTITGSSSILVSNGDGQSGNPTLSQIAASTVQLITTATGADGATVLGNYSKISLAGADGVSVTLTDEDAGGFALYTIGLDGTGSFVDSIDMSSDTGLIINPTGVKTGAVVYTVNLPGSGTSSAVEEGDLLVGGSSGEYGVLSVAGATTGDIVTYNGTTLVLSPPGASDVESVLIGSTTGLVINPATAQTGPVSIAVNLPGSGTSSVVEAGDLLYGTAGNAYEALSTNGASEGYLLTLDDQLIPAWSAPSAGTPWYTVSNPAGGTGADVNMGAHAWNNVGSLQLAAQASLTTPSSGFGTFWVGTDANNSPFYSSDALAALNVVTSDPTNYGVANTVLIGNGLSYKPLAAPTTPGDVLGWDGTNILWTANTPTILPSGVQILTQQGTTPNPVAGDFGNVNWYRIPNANLTANSVVIACPCLVGTSGPNAAAPGVSVWIDYANESTLGAGIWLFSEDGAAQDQSVAYSVIAY